MRVLLLDNSIETSLYGPVAHWGRHVTCELDSVRPPEGSWPSSLAGYSHIMVSGSEASINVDLPWIIEECSLVRAAAARGIPMLASCFGHQLVVRALSGKEHVRASPTPEFGWVEVVLSPEASRDPVVGWMGSSVHAYSAHFDEVHPLPPGWKRLASSAACENAMIAWTESPIWGIQHHPEIEPPEGAALFSAFLDKLPARRDRMLSCYCSEVKDSFVTGELVRKFLLT